MRFLPVTLLAATGVAAGLGLDASARPAAPSVDPVTITEWKVPWGAEGRPRDPYVAPDGKVWFVGQAGNYIAHLDPKTGQFKQFAIDSGTHPHNLIVDKRGMVWYAGNRNAMIGRLDPKDGAITRFPMPNGVPRDPHTLLFDNKHEVIWFTAQGAGKVGRLHMTTGKFDIVDVPTPNSRPYGIWMDSKNRPWFNEFGVNKIAMVDPATMTVKEYVLPHERARGRRIAVTSDDIVWWADYTRGVVGRLDPATGDMKEFPTPSGPGSLPYMFVADDKDRLWFVETQPKPSRLVGFDPKTEKFFSITPIAESGGLTVRHAYFHKPTRELWFGTDAGTIARAKLP
jgi:virginiamycin B lyase